MTHCREWRNANGLIDNQFNINDNLSYKELRQWYIDKKVSEGMSVNAGRQQFMRRVIYSHPKKPEHFEKVYSSKGKVKRTLQLEYAKDLRISIARLEQLGKDYRKKSLTYYKGMERNKEKEEENIK